jgi:hypothetical protein
MRRRATAPAVLLATVSACAAPQPSTVAPTTAQVASPTATTSSGMAITLPDPGRPFDAATLLAAMRDSRRPGGVPDELETDAIASALADAIWTFDGRPWEIIAAGGSCGPNACTLEIAGSPPGALGDDAWVFEVVPADSSLKVTTVELRGLPADLPPRLDELTRSLLPTPELEGMTLASARWLPPPEDGTFVLSYRGDGEEGSCGMDVTLDAAGEAVLEVTPVGC